MTTSTLQDGPLPADLYEVPGMPPPAGVVPNLENPYSRGNTYTAVATTITALMIAFVLCRMYTKYFIVRKMGWDDCELGNLSVIKAFCANVLSSDMFTWCSNYAIFETISGENADRSLW